MPERSNTASALAADDRRVVLHADDFGMSRSVTDGILQGFSAGLLTSASLLANAPDASRAVQVWKDLEQDRAAESLASLPTRKHLCDPDRSFDLGVHLNLTQGRPLTADRYPAELLDRKGRFPGIFQLFWRLWLYGGKFREAIEDELSQQIQFLLDRGIRPTHLNGHQYVEMVPAVTEVVVSLLDRFRLGTVRAALEHSRLSSAGLPAVRSRFLARIHWVFARRFAARIRALPVAHPDAYLGVGRAGRIDVSYLQFALGGRNSFRLAEIGLHPAQEFRATSDTSESGPWRDALATRRPEELRMLLSDELAEFLEKEHLRLGRLSVQSRWTGSNPPSQIGGLCCR
jgi:chitin disaccharide deacetylase